MALLLAACPSFERRWNEYLSSDTYEAGLLYIDLGELVHHLVDLMQRGQTSELAALFAVVERLHVEGEPFVREAATIGFLETLQNFAGNNGVDCERFEPYLLRESAKWWGELNRFWAGESPYVGAGLKKPE